MAATSYTSLPSNAYVGLGSQGELLHAANYGSYDAGIGSITAHPYQYQTPNYGTYLSDNHQPTSYSNEFLRSNQARAAHSTQEPQYHPPDRHASQETFNLNSQTPRQNNNSNHAPVTHKPPIDNHQHINSNHQHQPLRTDNTQQHHHHHHHSVSAENQQHPSQTPRDSSDQPSISKQQQRHQSQPNISRTEGVNTKQPASVPGRSPANPPPETRQTKSTKMRAAANKKREETREKKEREGFFPSGNKKSTTPKSNSKPRSASADEQSKKNKPKRDNKQSKPHKSRRDDYQTEDNNSSGDDDNQDEPPRNKSKKRTAFSDSHQDKLPPVRRGRGPPYHDPYYDYPYPPPPFRGRHPYYDDYPPYPYPGRFDPRHRRMYDDGYDAPPYVSGNHDPYDGFFDYDKRKGKSKPKKQKGKKESPEDRDAVTGNETEGDDHTKSSHSKKSKNHKNSNKDSDDNENEASERQRWYHPDYEAPHYDDRYALEIWRKERNDYLKKSYKPTVHDVLYSQQFMKSDSYVENQRRRALRESQGYYFPYKKYTLKDYKEMQKQEATHNPFAPLNEPPIPIDRKERAKKRHDYGQQIERQTVDTFGGQLKTPRDMPPKKPWHINNGEPNDPGKLSKRGRAIEYAKVQVTKNKPSKAPKNRPYPPDPTEQYVNSLFPHNNDNNDDEYSGDERDYQSHNDDD